MPSFNYHGIKKQPGDNKYLEEEKTDQTKIALTVSDLHEKVKLVLILHHGSLLRNVQTIQELPDVLIFDSGRLLDQSSGLTYRIN